MATLFFALWTVMSAPNFHAIYISVLEFNSEGLRIKLFTDDLQDAIRNFSDDFKPGETEVFLRQNERLIEAYFIEKIRIKINGQAIKMKLQASTIEADSYWITFDLGDTGEWQSLSVSDTHFMELFPNQTNIVKVMGSKQRFFKLTSSNASCSMDF